MWSCGAVSVGVSELLLNAKAVIAFEGDSLSVLSEDRSQGILVDHNPDDPIQAYELTVWGETWPLLILACERGG